MQLYAHSVIANKYKVVESQPSQFGEGYLVHELPSGVLCVLYPLSEALVANRTAMFYMQSMLKNLKHQQPRHTVTVREWHIPLRQGSGWIVTDYVKGKTLGEYVRDLGRLSLGETIALGQQIHTAIEQLSAHDLAVSGLNPNRVWIDLSGNVLLDVLATLRSVHEATGMLLENPSWHSPVEIQGHHELVSIYLWRFGLLTYYMLTGTNYWQSQFASVPSLITAIMVQPLRAPSEQAEELGIVLPPDYDRWFTKCLTRNPLERYASLTQAVAELALVKPVEKSAASQVVPLNYRENATQTTTSETLLPSTQPSKPAPDTGRSLVQWIKDKLAR